MATVIRRAGEHDVDALASLNADVQAVHAAALPWLFKPPGPDTFPPAEVAGLLERPGNLLFIAEIDGEAAGYAYAEIIRRPETAFHYAHDLVHLHHIGVRPAHRRRGVGGGLIAAVRAAAAENGITLVTIDVWTFNDAARAFFRRHGFVPNTERLWNR